LDFKPAGFVGFQTVADKGGGGVGFVARGDKAVGLSLVARVEGLLLLGFEVLDVVGAPTTAEDPVSLLHLDSHGFEYGPRSETL
jgi:hypothetical protein